MPFSDIRVKKSWQRAANGNPQPRPAYCECTRVTHDHARGRCKKELVWANRGREGKGKWEAHSRSGKHHDSSVDCLIYCWSCHKSTFKGSL